MNVVRKKQKDQKIQDILFDIRKHEQVQKMKQFIQHGHVSTYEHCEAVTSLSYEINKRLHLHADPDILLKGAMLHDFYLYDWHEKGDGTHRLHGFRHAEIASRNAIQYLDMDEKICHVIRSHMWPLNPVKIPKIREAWIVCLADKCVSLHETFFRRRKKGSQNNRKRTKST